MIDDDISSLVTILWKKHEADMNLVAVEFTYYAMKTFYKIYHQNSSFVFETIENNFWIFQFFHLQRFVLKSFLLMLF